MTIPEIQQTKERFVLQVKPLEAKELGYQILSSLQANNVQQSNPEAYESLLNEAVSLLTYALPKLSDDEYETLMKEYLPQVLRNQATDPEVDVDFKERFETRFMLYPDEYEIVYKMDLTKLLHSSQALIGSNPIKLSIEKSEEPPTISNWLAYYEKKHGDNYTDSFKRSQFLAGDEHVQALDATARQDIQNLLTFMDYLNEFPALAKSLEEESPSIESLSPPQPARETMSREILESPPESKPDPNKAQSPQAEIPTTPFGAPSESASDVMNQPPVSPQQPPEPTPINSQDPPQFLGQEPPQTTPQPPDIKPRTPGTVDLSKVKLPNTQSKSTIDLKKLS